MFLKLFVAQLAVALVVLLTGCDSGKEKAKGGVATPANPTAKQDGDTTGYPTYESMRVLAQNGVSVLSENDLPADLVKSEKFGKWFGNRQARVAFQNVLMDNTVNGTIAYFTFQSSGEADRAFSQYQEAPPEKPAVAKVVRNHIIVFQVRGHDQMELNRFSERMYSIIEKRLK